MVLKEEELFNPKTIERLSFGINPTKKQKEAAKMWLAKLEFGELKGEKSNYLAFDKYILRDLLGYSIDDTEFEKNNVEFGITDPKTGKRKICLEVKGMDTKDLFERQARTKSEHSTPVKQLWSYMNQDATPYGIATNYRIFLLFDYSKGEGRYYQFDFFDIKKDQDKLKEFIAIFSREQILEKGFVEKLHEESIVEEREFTKEFYKLFHETRLMLIKEFKENAEFGDESAPIHFAQLFLNRLMFVFFAQDTDKLEKHLFEKRILSRLSNLSDFSENSYNICESIKADPRRAEELRREGARIR